MADTQRSKSDLVGRHADNSTGDISPQDNRDIIESMHFSFGSYYFSSSAATSPAGAGTYLKAAGTTTSVGLHRFTMPSNNRLTYTGTPDVHVHCAVSLSAKAGASNKSIGFMVYKNGSPLAHSEIRMYQGIGASASESTALHSDFTLSTNDYIELWLANHTDTNTVTVTYGYCFCMGMFV